MVRENRIKHFTIPLGSLTVTAAGILASPAYHENAVNGTIVKIWFNAGSYIANGSIGIAVSGTNEAIWTYKNAGASAIDYPMVYPVDNARTTGSPSVSVQRVIGADIQPYIWVSGGGNATKASGLTVYYI